MKINLDWQSDAACAQIGTDIFDMDAGAENHRYAAMICATCPVYAECFAYAKTFSSNSTTHYAEIQGVYAGHLFYGHRAPRRIPLVSGLRRDARYADRGADPRECVVCGTSITHLNHRAITCGPICKQARRRKTRLAGQQATSAA